MPYGVANPGWLALIAALLALLTAVTAYARLPGPLRRSRRAGLAALRVTALLVILFLLLSPVRTAPAPPVGGVVAILIDHSRSMAIRDVDDTPRLDHAVTMVREVLAPAFAADYDVELFALGERLVPARLDHLEPVADRAAVGPALAALADHLGERRLAGVVVVSDGGYAGSTDAVAAAGQASAPVFTTGVGRGRPARDREVVGVTAGDPTARDSTIDVTAVIASVGFGTDPIDVRLLENGRPVDRRRVAPATDGAPVRVVFRASPTGEAGTVYTVEVPVDPGELVAGNNRWSVVVPPAERPRRLLMVEGAPGYEHSFLKRTWFADAGLALDAVVRKGRNDRGEPTFYVQGDASSAAALADGYPRTADTLFRYDAVVLANLDAEFFDTAQLALTTEFVATRGGGVLLLGPESLRQRGYRGSSFEPVLPARLVERLGLAEGGDAGGAAHRMMLTDDGAAHPVMQLGTSPTETRDRWSEAPALAGTVRIGPVRPGASVLARAAAGSETGAGRPVVVVQRFGAGRSMLFAGRASWRWQMLRPAADRVYETFWGQVGRWLSAAATDQVTIRTPAVAIPDRPVRVGVEVRDAEFRPVSDARVVVTATDPAGASRQVEAGSEGEAVGRYTAVVTPARAGVYRLDATATRRGDLVGAARDWLLSGGHDPELADPWLAAGFLGRVAAAGGGAYVALSDLPALPEAVRAAPARRTPTVTRERAPSVWLYLAVVGLLSAEWRLRRRWGMR